MASRKEEVTYELLILIGGKWQVHNVYKANKVNVAMGDAKSLQKISTTQSVKLVKEFYDKETGKIRQLITYESDPQKPKKQPSKQAKKASGKAKKKKQKASTEKKSSASKKDGKATPSNINLNEAPPPPQKISGFMILVQIMLSLLVSLGAAMLVSTIASQMLKGVDNVSSFSKDDILAGIFIMVFAAGSIILIIKIFSRALRAARFNIDRDDYTSAESSNVENPSEKQQHDPRLALPPEAVVEMKQPHPLTLGLEDEETDENDDEADTPPGIIFDDDDEPLPDEVVSTVKQMNRFVQKSLKALEGGMSGADPYASFGVSLYMVGASHALCQENKTPEEFQNEVIGECLRIIGFGQDRIDHLVSRSDEYLVSDPRYLQMYQVGRSAMGIWLESGIGAEEAFAMSYENWIKPRPKPLSPPPVVVLFTDIAGSTAMTQERGDEGAQQVVREHNRIVREALSIFQGREIKHTGDGIMASFSTGVSGVEAAIDMQQKVLELANTNSDLPLQLKIGINVGEPISEDNDLFGSTVQLAARIVDKAAAGEVLISEAVHGLTQGKKIPFEKHDEFEMKGFDHPIATYRVIWEDYFVNIDDENGAEIETEAE